MCVEVGGGIYDASMLVTESCIFKAVILQNMFKIALGRYFNFTQTQHFYNWKMLIFSAHFLKWGKHGRCFARHKRFI